MTAARLKYLSSDTIQNLRATVRDNLDRYRAGDFSDLMPSGEWAIELDLDADLSVLDALDPAGTPEVEIKNSRLVWKALSHLTPALACEEGIWARLTHVECLAFARNRWIRTDADDEAVAKAVTDHFFAATLTSRRDDNAISRLWWNAYIANLAFSDAELSALNVILKKADIRSNFVERSLTASRPALTAGMVRIMQREAKITEREDSFRSFMRSVNKLGGGIVFEAMSEADIDAFMKLCAARAGLLDSERNADSASATISPEVGRQSTAGEDRSVHPN
jgi:hypothetical protein